MSTKKSGGLKYFQGLEEEHDSINEDPNVRSYSQFLKEKKKGFICIGITLLIAVILVIAVIFVLKAKVKKEEEDALQSNFAECSASSIFLTGDPMKGPQSPPPNFKVAFIGDQGLNDSSKDVLHLIKSEKADMVLHQGDFDYRNDPEAWEAQFLEILGENYPYFAVIGNHDTRVWSGYEQVLYRRMKAIGALDYCYGAIGVKTICNYKGLFFALSGVGTLCDNHHEFLSQTLQKFPNFNWRICSYHRVNQLMQAGYDPGYVDLETYDICRRGGAIIATAHQHSYQRTHLLSDFAKQTIASTNGTLKLKRGDDGTSFAFVSGMGGIYITPSNPEFANKPWWASVYTSSTPNATFGALFCSFKDGTNAHCYFKNINQQIIDEFEIENSQ